MPDWPSGQPRFNHVGFTVSSETLSGANKLAIIQFFDEIFGWQERKGITREGKLLAFEAGRFDQFLVLMGHDHPATVNAPSDHLGLVVESPGELDKLFDRCRSFEAKDPRLKVGEMEFTSYAHPTMGQIGIQQFFVVFLFGPALEIVCYDAAGAAASARKSLTDEERRAKEERFQQSQP